MTPFQISEELINEFKVDIESHNINSLKKEQVNIIMQI